jgi:hypothetical protein
MEGKPSTHQVICECKRVLRGQIDKTQDDNVPIHKSRLACTSNQGLGYLQSVSGSKYEQREDFSERNVEVVVNIRSTDNLRKKDS